MSLLSLFFTRKSSAPVARERLQVLLAHERIATGHSELLAKLQEEIIQVIARHIKIDRDQVHVKLDRRKDTSTLEIDVDLPAVMPFRSGWCGSSLLRLQYRGGAADEGVRRRLGRTRGTGEHAGAGVDRRWLDGGVIFLYVLIG